MRMLETITARVWQSDPVYVRVGICCLWSTFSLVANAAFLLILLGLIAYRG